MFHGNNILNSYLKAGVPIFLLGALISFQYAFDVQRKDRPSVPPVIIPAGVLKFADLGLHSAASAIMWIYTVQQTTAHPDKLVNLIETVTGLDPKFSYPYAFSAVVLPSMGLIKEGIGIAESGIGKADSDWRIPYYLGTSHHIFLDDRKNAILYFEMATKTPGAPDEIKTIVSRYGTAQTVRSQTKEIWASVYETTDDELIKERAKNYLAQIEILEVLEKAVTLYKQKFGRYPKKIEDLIQPGILKAIPPSPFNLQYSVNTDGSIRLGY